MPDYSRRRCPISIFNRNTSPYYVIQEGTRWNIYQKTATGAKRLGAAANRSAAEKIALALEVYDLAEDAAKEMMEGNITRSHREALMEKFVQVEARRKREARQLELSSCSTRLTNFFVTLLLGITTIALLVLLLRQIFG